ncbi:MAG: conserved rane protein of unknown function [Clostridiales bacterium]|jgi:hypothetical protein|nr:conserved rane protein of unknown function [Clostridiales bacterium]
MGLKWKEWLYRVLSVKLIVGRFINQTRFQLEQVNNYSELDIRIKTINMCLISTVIYLLAVFVFLLFSSGIVLTIVFCVCSIFLAASVQGMMIEHYKYKLLKQQIVLNEQIRNSYFEYKAVSEAIYEATHLIDDIKNHEVVIQAYKIIEVLGNKDIEAAAIEYNEKAPNKYLKLLMNIAYITCEYGDTILEGGASLFLRSIATLNLEVRTELIKRERINFLLKGLNFIIVLPLLFVQPIKGWASANFPPLELFYLGYLGKFLEVLIIGMVFGCYYLLSKLQKNDFSYKASSKQSFIERIMYFSLFKKIAFKITPKIDSYKYREVSKRLNSILSSLTIQEYYHRKVLSAAVFGLGMVVVNIGIVQKVESNIIEANVVVINLIFFIFGALFGCIIQDLTLRYQEKLMKIEVEEEISQLQIVLSNLIYIKQINVFELLEWMELFSIHLKNPLQRCIINYDSGAKKSLEELAVRVANPNFSQIVGNLILASSELSIAEAFDDLETEKSFYMENRKINNEKIIQRKQWIGQTIGFMPLYFLIIVFLTIPMIISSLSQMQVYFSQLTKL